MIICSHFPSSGLMGMPINPNCDDDHEDEDDVVEVEVDKVEVV